MMSPQRLYIDNYFLLYFIGKICIILFKYWTLEVLGNTGSQVSTLCSILPLVAGILGRD